MLITIYISKEAHKEYIVLNDSQKKRLKAEMRTLFGKRLKELKKGAISETMIVNTKKGRITTYEEE